MPLFRSKAEDKVRDAGYDPARLPPGQYLTEKWPVLHAGDVPDIDIATWTLSITGEVAEQVTLGYDELRALPATEVTTDIHCVTRWSRLRLAKTGRRASRPTEVTRDTHCVPRWSRFDAGFKGVHWSELAKLCKPKPTAKFAIAHAAHGFTANVPLRALRTSTRLSST